MYTDELKSRTVAVSQIFLDPNNPRFWNEAHTSRVPDEKVTLPPVQEQTGAEIDNHGTQELYGSILRSGFLLLDRIVVRPLRGETDKYVIVEGNRRFRALSKLRSDIAAERAFGADDLENDALQELLARTVEIEVLVYEGSDTEDISWIFQGIRHISGIRSWPPTQRAKLVADQIDQHNKSYTTAGQQFGLSGIAVGRLYRAHRALRQMELDDEFKGRVKNDYFSLFDEALKNATMRDWLDWSETARRFQNINNVKRFYGWITPDEDHSGRRRIHDPHQIKDVAYLIENGHKTLLGEFEDFVLSIADARKSATADDHKDNDWRQSMRGTEVLLGELPQSAMADDAEEFLGYLRRLAQIVAERIEMVEAVVERSNADQD